MKRRTSRAGTDPVTGPLRRSLPLLLQTLLVVALALPAGLAVAPAFLGPGTSANRRAAAPPWHQVPGTLAARDARRPAPPRTASDRSLPRPPSRSPAPLAAQLNETLKTDGAGNFTGVVQDAATGEVLFDRSGDEVRVPASNMKLLTAAAALRTLGPERRFSTRAVAGAAPGSRGAHRRRRRAPRRRRIGPGAVLGHAGLASLAQSTVRALQDDGVSVPVTVLLDDSLFTGPALNPAWSPEDVAAGEVAPLFPLALNSARFDPAKTTGPAPAGRRDERRRGVLRPARGGRPPRPG